MRSVWKGHIRFSLVNIPIQIFNAVESKGNLSFNQLHNKDHGRVKYKKVCASCEEEVPYGDIVKGYEYQPDQYVVLQPEELATLKLQSTKSIDIEAFVEMDEVPASRYEAVYFVGPNGEGAQKTFSLFCQTLKKSGKAGVGRIILRDREDVVLIKPRKHGLVMYKLRFPYELRSIDDVPDLVEIEVDQAQLDLAQTLVSSLEKPFSEIDFTDRYKDALLELVEDKINGKEIIPKIESAESAPVVDIMDALKASIEAAKEKKKS